MHKKTIRLTALTFLLQVVFPGITWQARAQAGKSPYAAMARVDRYLMPDEHSEIALARSASPVSISDRAEVLVLGRDGYSTAVKGGNGFVCLVERSWDAATYFPEFWNSKIRSPICVNPPAARTYLPTVLTKAKLVLALKSETEIAQAVKSPWERNELPALEPGAMC